MPPSITVDLALIDAKPPLRALADVLIVVEDFRLKVRRCAVFEKAGQEAWATFPRLIVGRGGLKLSLALVDIQGDMKKRVFEAILDEYRRQTNAS